MTKLAWKPAPKRGYVVCQRCFAIVEDKGFKRVQHIVSAACQSHIDDAGGAPTQEGE